MVFVIVFSRVEFDRIQSFYMLHMYSIYKHPPGSKGGLVVNVAPNEGGSAPIHGIGLRLMCHALPQSGVFRQETLGCDGVFLRSLHYPRFFYVTPV